MDFLNNSTKLDGAVFSTNEVRENQAVTNLGELSTERALFTLSAISSHLESLGYPEKSLKSMQLCGKTTGQKMIKHCSSCGDTHIIDLTYHCNLRTCLECSQIRKRRSIRKYFPFFNQFSTSRGSAKSLYFLTISPKNYENLKDGLGHIKRSWNKFIRTKYIKERVEGGLWVIETKNIGNEWNIHIHALFYGRRLDNCIRGKCYKCGQNLIKFDKSINQFYCANKKCGSLDVEVNKNSRLVGLFTSSSERECHIDVKEIIYGPKAALNYVLKYISSNKDDFSTPQQFAEYIFFTRKQKLINLFGTFFKFKPQKSSFKCNLCGGQIEFIYDMQVIYYFEQNPNKINYGPPDFLEGY